MTRPGSPASPVASTPLDPSRSVQPSRSGESVSAESVESADSSPSPAIVGPLGPVGRVTAASYSGASTAAVAFPDPARRPYPDPRPAGSAVSASSALHTVLEDNERGTLMDTLGMEVITRDADKTEVRMPIEGARQVVGILHGGATAALIETAASVAGRLLRRHSPGRSGTDGQPSAVRDSGLGEGHSRSSAPRSSYRGLSGHSDR